MQRDVCARRFMVPVLMAAGLALSGCQSPAGTPGTPTITGGGPIPSAVGTPGGATSGSSDAASGAGASTLGPTTAAEVRANVPEAARQHTPEGATAFVRYYIEMINDASFRRQKGLLAGLADPRCVTCRAADRDIEDLLSKDQRYQQAPLEVVGVYPGLTPQEGQQMVGATVNDIDNRVVDARGKVKEVIHEGKARYLFDLRWSGNGAWLVREFQVDLVSENK